MNLDGTDLREVLSFGMRNNTRGEWISDDHIAFVTDRAGRDQLGVLTLATGAVDWLGGEPELFPHDVVAGTQGRFACIAHDRSRSYAALWDGALRDMDEPVRAPQPVAPCGVARWRLDCRSL